MTSQSLSTSETVNVQWAQQWCKGVLQAYAEDNAAQLAKLASSALKVDLGAQALLLSGAGFLCGDNAIWARGSDATFEVVAVVRKKWQAAYASATKLQCRSKCASPFVKLAPAEFHVAVSNLQLQGAERLGNAFSAPVLREAAVWLALSGFSTLASLDQAEIEDVVIPRSKAAVNAAVAQLITAATDDAVASRALKKRCLAWDDLLPLKQSESIGANTLMDMIAPDAIQTKEAGLDEAMKSVGLRQVPEKSPMLEIQAWAAAKRSGANVELLLTERSQLLSLEGVRTNAKSKVSALKAWHACCVDVLGVPENATLPPRSIGHVRAFVGMFKNGATAANYLNHILAACKVAQLSTDWHDSAVQQIKVDARARSKRLGVCGQKEVVTLPAYMQTKLLSVTTERGDAARGVSFGIYWKALLRVQSEGCGIMVGAPSWASGLPQGIMAAVWAHADVLFLRLRTRKHRVHGSLLQILCSCKADGPSLCVVHSFMRLQLKPHDWLIRETPYQILKMLRHYLRELHFDRAGDVTLKTFRASAASAMVASGEPLARILAAGEWKSSAFLNYVDESEVDRQKYISSLLDAEEDELEG